MKKILGLLILSVICSALLALGGQFLGSLIFISWTHINAEPSLGMLYTLYQHRTELNPRYVMPFRVIGGISLFLPVIPYIMAIVVLLSKSKRELHGSARFATPAEIREAGLLKENFDKDEPPDILLGKLGKQFLRWASTAFAFVTAETRGGKGIAVVIPNLLHYAHSLVNTDPKLENFVITAGFREKALKQKVFLFNPGGRTPEHTVKPDAPLVSHRYNPCTYIRRDPRYTYKDILIMAEVLIPRPVKDSSGTSGFFADSAQKLFTGLMLYMIETEHERDLTDISQKTTLSNLFRLTTPSNGKTLAEWIKEEIMLRDQQEATRLSTNCKTLLLGFANGNAKTGADIVATLTAPLGIFLDPVVEAATSGDDFYLTDLRKQRMTVYVAISPEDISPLSRLLNLFYSQLIAVNLQQGLPENNPLLKYQCLLLKDEFPSMGYMKSVINGVPYMAGYNLRLLIIMQSPAQIADLYGKDAARTFFTNFNTQISFTCSDKDDAEELSKMIGYETFKTKSWSRSSGRGSSRSQSVSDQRRAVMLPQELSTLPYEKCIIKQSGRRPILADKIMYYKDEVFKKRANMPLPQIPVLDIPGKKTVRTSSSPVAQYIPVEQLPQTDWRDTANAEVIGKALLGNLVTPDSSPEFIAELSKYIDANLGIDSMPIFKAVLTNT
ncbi:type IV secretory system conjugative DNA transfer family protein [Snodgrassella sp.]|uniref:type IV secretory system conjugative DNA transfer family protein n=1 Tax=Snodgrassella sp. TaxID=2815304 RepID=UPI0025839493|nr:type IV secretory system conjugative DNA transfer family protein [Snodgrassella sp.]MCO6525503.1 type IV secretory system conjugative DNA transfer family protein [Snodgrassella sp.]